MRKITTRPHLNLVSPTDKNSSPHPAPSNYHPFFWSERRFPKLVEVYLSTCQPTCSSLFWCWKPKHFYVDPTSMWAFLFSCDRLSLWARPSAYPSKTFSHIDTLVLSSHFCSLHLHSTGTADPVLIKLNDAATFGYLRRLHKLSCLVAIANPIMLELCTVACTKVLQGGFFPSCMPLWSFCIWTTILIFLWLT
jgi:hypothetical protein